MTIANVVLNAEVATVAVDTLGAFVQDPARAEQGVMKMLPLPAARAILLGRGSAEVLLGLFIVCYLNANDYDVLAGRIPQQMNESLDRVNAVQVERLGAEHANAVNKTEIYCVGWSQASSRMRGLAIYQEEPGGPYMTREIRYAVAMGDPKWGAMLRPGDEISMIKVARLQMELARSRNLPGHGGELIIAHIDRNTISIRNAGKL